MQVFYSQMCDLIKLGLNGRVFQCPRFRYGFFSYCSLVADIICVPLPHYLKCLLLCACAHDQQVEARW